MVDLALLAYSAIGALCVAVAAVLWTNRDVWLPIVSRQLRASLDRARAQKAARERLYSYVELEPEPPVRTTVEPPEPVVVLSDAHQVEPVEPVQNEPVREPVNLRQLPKADLIVLLAVQRKENGEYTYSSNEITSFVGGTAADVKKLIAEVRGEAPAEQAKRLGHLPRPTNGWV